MEGGESSVLLGLLCREVVVRLEIDRKDLTGLGASRRHPKNTEGRRASRACREVEELVRMELCECGGLGQADDVRDLAVHKQEARRDMVRGQCDGWREWREGLCCGEWRAFAVVVSGGLVLWW